MASYSPPDSGYDLGGFNTYYYNVNDVSITLAYANSHYLAKSGGFISNDLTIGNNLNVIGNYYSNGSLLNFSAISGITNGLGAPNKALILDGSSNIASINNITTSTINATSGYSLNGTNIDIGVLNVTAGTASASKALILDGSSNITSINSLSSTSLTTSTLNLNGSINLGSNLNTTINNNIMITGGNSVFTTGNGLGLRFNTFVSTGYIKAYNYGTSALNKIDFNDASLFIDSNKRVGINTTSPLYDFHVGGTQYISTRLLINSADTSRLISALNPSQSIGSKEFITVGQANSSGNQGEIGFYYNGSASSSNMLTLGLHSKTMFYIKNNSTISCFTEGSKDFNVITGASPAIRLGKAESAYNCCSIQWYHAGDGSNDNAIAFDMYGTSKNFVCSGRGCSVNGSRNNYASLEVYGYISFSSTYKYYNVSNNTYGTVTGSSTNLGLAVSDGNIWCNNSLVTSSDRRIKFDIQNYDVDLNAYKMLEPVIYRKNANPSKQEIGLIAQDVLKVGFHDLLDLVPNKDMVQQNQYDPPNGAQWTLEYDRVSIVNMCIIKKLIARIEELENKINNL